MRPFGLILAGGGAKGAYQMGAWRAMLDLGVEFEAIAGTSIGAINGALIAQGNFDKAMKFWGSAEVANGINLPGELKANDNLFSFSNMPQIFHEVIKNGGVDVSPAKQIVADNIDETVVRANNIPLAIVTFDLNGMKPVEMFVDEMPEGTLVDYLMASARFPGLNNQGPEDTKYIDGGVYDNAPLGVLRKKGINRLIVIDISSRKGIGHKPDWSCADIIYIRPYDVQDLGAAFEFDKEMNERRMSMGYYDTKKAFGYLYGLDYYFNENEYRKLLAEYGYKTCGQLEGLARSLGVERLQIYSAEAFIEAIKVAYLAKLEKQREEERLKEEEKKNKKKKDKDSADYEAPELTEIDEPDDESDPDSEADDEENNGENKKEPGKFALARSLFRRLRKKETIEELYPLALEIVYPTQTADETSEEQSKI
ncbi:MAG: patatin-like phospholipase family protein [Clostridia bacterium]|nr:patatin-like phospholipase family protein [Clostridia bacterium]